MKKIVLMIIFVFLSTLSVYADQTEIATAHAYYKHPVTGVIEDAGNNYGIGQGMCESVLHENALFEEVDGQIYACVRYNLADNIKDVSFSVQNRNQQDFSYVDYEIVNSTATTKDYRFKVPAKDAVVRSSFFVVPMGRAVVFYMDFSDFVVGNTDFVPLGQNGKMKNLLSSKEISGAGEKVTINAVNNLITAGDLGYSHGLLTKNSPEIIKIYGKEKVPTAKNDKGKTNKTSIYTSLLIINVVMTVLTVLAVIMLVTPFVLYVVLKKLKSVNELRKVELYEKG